MTLTYPGLWGKPIIVVSVEDLLTGARFFPQMLVDTGADETCFPAKLAAYFGHNNHDPRVKTSTCRGVGGVSKVFLHSVRIGLIDPVASTKTKTVIAWNANQNCCSFVDKLSGDCGLIGMDVMRQWKSITFRNTSAHQMMMEIVI